MRLQSANPTAPALPECRCYTATGRLCTERTGAFRSTPPVLRLVEVAALATEVPATNGPARPRRTLALSDERFEALSAFVERSIDTSLPTSVLADVAGLSVSYFHRAFVLRTGQTPHAWIMGLRLRRARELILESATSLTAIAADCGFFDQAHLTNTFRRIHGQSPHRWREEQAARRGNWVQELSGHMDGAAMDKGAHGKLR
ncbi:helix-turn-helix domain-containing protein [Luteibacter aegosomatissinici]|uniref:helix-turn-helix domain-containing protein n=1 Tax=Luteibacter aegosomatissinici TaxID=2911539 RepID=UPI001FFA2E1F|nr:helix-turn-helix transcriptional regulator [Luteibacter aegosomatissinici]UPG92732.1 helix-turn-helix transcriptional regulator [Luteibacter aegosomatissinici]